MKKRLISMLLAGTMALSLTACGGGNGGTSDGGDENTLVVYAWDPSFNIPAIQAAA